MFKLNHKIEMKGLLSLLILVIPNFIFSQKTPTCVGIKWDTLLSWNEIKEKAKSENKFIFLDAFTTWCGPCKKMDKEVYSTDVIGKLFDKKFISIKLQMNKTKMDNDLVKSLYSFAEEINRQHKIIAYPSYLFFSSEGTLLYKEVGFKSAIEFEQLAETATYPGRVYKDPYAKYDSLVTEYQKGKRDYEEIYYLIEISKKLGHFKLYDSLVNDYYEFLGKLNDKDLFTKANISFVSLNIRSINDRFFPLFYVDGKNIDKLMNKKGFSRFTVDHILEIEYIDPFLQKFYSKVSFKEAKAGTLPDWIELSKSLDGKINSNYVKRAIRAAKVKFYWSMQDLEAYVKCMSLRMNKNDLDLSSEANEIQINACAWKIFQKSTDKELIKSVTKWMQNLAKRYTNMKLGDNAGGYLDTYANLLYKANLLFKKYSLEEAIKWEERAAEMSMQHGIAKNDKFFIEEANQFKGIIQKMKKHEPTW